MSVQKKSLIIISLLLIGGLRHAAVALADDKKDEPKDVLPFTFEPYGFVKAAVHGSNSSVSSFGSDSVQAPTEAQNTNVDSETQSSDYKGRFKSAFQVAQSRLGTKVKSRRTPTEGRFEVDLIDFANEPITASGLRLRLAEIVHEFNPAFELRAGQGWATFAGLLPHTINFVGAGYRAGSSAFLAQQVETKLTVDDYRFYLAVGHKGRNVTGVPRATGVSNPAVQDVSHIGFPLLTLKSEYVSSEKNGTGDQPLTRIGAAAVYGRFEYDRAPLASGQENEVTTQGLKGYLSIFEGPVEFRAETYYGSNLNDLFFLTLASSSIRRNDTEFQEFNEVGGFVSANYRASEEVELFLGGGLALLPRSGCDCDNYNALADGVLVNNQVGRIGARYFVDKNLSVGGEITHYRSGYTSPGEANDVDVQYSNATTGELALIYRF